MSKFVAQLNDGSYINTPADTMVVKENMLFAYKEGKLVALVDLGAQISARIENVTRYEYDK